MPSFETMDRHQTAVLFPIEGEDGYNEPIRGAAVELDVRWNWRHTWMTGPQGTPIALDATVVVDRDVAVGSQIWEGTLDEWNGTGSAEEETRAELMEVKAFRKTKDIKGRNTRWTLGLVKFRETQAEES